MTLTRPAAYRQSLIAAFDSCNRRALYALLDERRSPSPLAAHGTILHAALRTCMREMKAHGEETISVEQGLEILAETWMQRDVPADQVVPLRMENMRWDRVKMVKWCETMQFSIDRLVDVEKRLYADIVLPTGEVQRITGQLDTLFAGPGEDEAGSVDYKTGFGRAPGRDNNEDGSRGKGLTPLGWVQSLIYAYLVFASYPSVQRFWFREVHVLFGETREVVIDRYEIERLTDVLAAQVALLDQAVREGEDSERWVASPGPHCALCSGTRLCPIRRQVGAPADEGEARRLAGEWILSAEIRKERAPLLKGWVEAHGPVEVPYSRGRRFVGWDYSPNGSRNFTVFEAKPISGARVPESLEAAAREAGVLSDE